MEGKWNTFLDSNQAIGVRMVICHRVLQVEIIENRDNRE